MPNSFLLALTENLNLDLHGFHLKEDLLIKKQEYNFSTPISGMLNIKLT